MIVVWLREIVNVCRSCLDGFVHPALLQICAKLQVTKTARFMTNVLTTLSVFALGSGPGSTRAGDLVKNVDTIQQKYDST